MIRGAARDSFQRWKVERTIHPKTHRNFVERDCHNMPLSRALIMTGARPRKNYASRVRITPRRGYRFIYRRKLTMTDLENDQQCQNTHC